MNNVTRIALLGASLSIMPSPAFAYIDPAVGSMIFQGIVGAIAVAGTAWYTLRAKVAEIFQGAKAQASDSEPNSK